MTAGVLLDRLHNVRAVGPGRWHAGCPLCQSRRGRPVSVRELDDGTVLVHPFCGCASADVITAVGVEFAQLFPKRLEPRGPLPRSEWPRIPTRAAQERLDDAAHVCGVLATILSDLENGAPLTPELAARFRKGAGAVLSLAKTPRGHT